MSVWNYPPRDFWVLSPGELWWLLEAKMPPKEQELTESDWQELYDMLD